MGFVRYCARLRDEHIQAIYDEMVAERPFQNFGGLIGHHHRLHLAADFQSAATIPSADVYPAGTLSLVGLVEAVTRRSNRLIQKIISGGQTGADRAALDFAIEHGIPHGGWCPKGRLAEDGMIDQRYQLKETSTSNYPERTEKNIQDSDGTVIFTMTGKLTGGSKKTAEFSVEHQKPWIHLHPGKETDISGDLVKFVRDNQI